MLHSMTFRTLSTAGLLALAVSVYVMSGPNDGLLAGPGRVSALLHSLSIVGF